MGYSWLSVARLHPPSGRGTAILREMDSGKSRCLATFAPARAWGGARPGSGRLGVRDDVEAGGGRHLHVAHDATVAQFDRPMAVGGGEGAVGDEDDGEPPVRVQLGQ